jgi:hypothetical protein
MKGGRRTVEDLDKSMVVLIIHGPERDSMEPGNPRHRKLIRRLDQFWLSGRMLAQ